MSKKKKSLKFTFAAKTQQKIVRKTKQKKKLCDQRLTHHTDTPLRAEGLGWGYFEFLNTISFLHPVDE